MMYNLIVSLFFCVLFRVSSKPDHAPGERVMIISSDFEIGYLLAALALLGVILVGSLLTALHLNRWHPKLVSATIGVLLGFALIEAVPLFT
jgi:hypothetical protein